MIHVVDPRAAEHIEPAHLVQHRDMLFHRGRDRILGVEFGDRALNTLGRRAVVGLDIDNQRIVADTHRLDRIHQLADLHIGMFQEAGIDLHQPLLEGGV